jgi:serine/threonine-protein kinase
MVMESLKRLDPPRRLGKMTLLARLGDGGMASVYVTSVGDGPLARLAAVKLLRAGAPDHDYRNRFLDEARVVVRLHHNNIVDVREAGEAGGQLYIAMELIEGRDLADIWDRCAEVGRAFPLPIGVYLIREILRGLHYAHTFPGLALVHRDVSPSNVLVDWAGAVRLADFGLATSAMKGSMTVPGLVFGKVGYMAPEQAVKDDLDPRADVYSCGVVLWELITGRPLREPGTDTQAVAGWEASRPSKLSRRVDADLDDIVLTALQHDREDRFDSAHEFMSALTQWLADHAPQTTQETVADFLRDLFGDARKRDHAEYTKLLELSPRTAVWDRRRATRDIRPPGEDEMVPAGTVLAERYRVERTIGQGGMGIVYLAEHMGVGRQVAVKVLTTEWSRHDVVARRFREEARAANAAGHPHIVDVYDAGRLEDGRLYMAMEFLTGRSLYEEIVDVGPLDLVRACRIIGQVADAIGAAHRVGIVHRDLKPDNVMLVARDDGDFVKVLDFGISASAVRSEAEQRLTRPGHCVGTPEYMAPEQAKGLDPTPRFDIYALGVMLYEALAGEPPFSSDNLVEVLTRKATERAPRLRGRRPEVPQALAELCHECLEIEPALRPASAALVKQRLDAVIADLERADELDRALQAVGSAEGNPIKVPPAATEQYAEPGVPPSAPYAAADRRWLVGGAIGLAAVVAVGIAWALPSAVEPAPEPTTASLAFSGIAHGSSATPAATDPGPTPRVRESEPELAPDPEPPAVAPRKVARDRRAPPPPAEPEPVAADEAGVLEPEVEAVPAARADSRPATTNARKDPSRTPECDEARARAEAAFKRRDWRAALSQLRSRRCWKHHGGRFTAMKVQALFQTGHFDECVEFGEGSPNPDVASTVHKCRRKR